MLNNSGALSASELSQLMDRRNRLQRILPSDSPDQLLHRGFVVPPSFDYGWRYPGSDSRVAPDEEQKPPKEERPTAAQLKKLEMLAEQISMGIEARIPRRSGGRREAQYLELVQGEKEQKATPNEIVSSEIPVPLDRLSGEKLTEIINSGIVSGIYSKGPNRSTTEYKCSVDGRLFTRKFMFFCGSKLYCPEHVPTLEVCVRCRNMREGCSPVTTFDGREVMACISCVGSVTRCEGCHSEIGVEYIEFGRCQDCIDSPDEGSHPYRKFSMSLKWGSKEQGTIVKSDRLYSAEIESVSPDSAGVYRYSEAVPKEVGLSTDGSIDSNGGYGFETQTPRLQGKKGEELLYRMGAALKEIGAVVNKSCGMHVHLDGKGIIAASRREYPAALLQLWKAHLVFEEAIMSFLPYARRRNDYCRPMNDNFKLEEIDGCESLLDAERLWYKRPTYREIQSAKGHHYHSSRYFGVNLHSLLGQGHLEIRYHSGTTNARKTLEWANLHALIMDAAAAKKFTPEFLKEAQATTVLREKSELLFELIGLTESSRQYFRARQKKFGNKQVDESEIKSD